MCLLHMYTLNLIALYFSFHDSVAILYNMDCVYSLNDSVQFAVLNLSDIEEQRVVYKLYESEDNISDITVSSAHTSGHSHFE